MQIDNNTRIEIYSKSSPTQKYLYGSFETAKILSPLIQKYQFKENAADTFIVTVGDIILGFYKTEDIIPLLQQELELDEATADKLGTDVLAFLAPLSDPTWQPPTDDVTENIKNSGPVTTELSTVTLSAPQAPTQIEEPGQHEPTVIPEIRTMAADMAQERSPARNTFNAAAEIDEPVHVSTQPTIEKKMVDVPSYSSTQYQSPKPDAPITDSRWN